ncbi:MAG: ATP-binding protein [Candidatus Neomarinimicrobiota bacterium]
MIPILVGARRTGKSTLFFQMITELRKSIPASNILYVNYEDDRLAPLTGGELSNLLNIYRQNYHPSADHLIYLFLDEVQNVPGWEQTVRRIHETEAGVRLILTGSNARMLSREIATALRGRTLSKKVHPLSFPEFIRFKTGHSDQPNPDTMRYSSEKDRLLNLFDEYLHFGGFPMVVLAKEQQVKEQILKEYMNTIFFRDIVERHSVRNYRALDMFTKILCRQISALVSYGKLVNSLKSIGIPVSKNTVIDYLSYIEEAFLGNSVSIYSYSIKDQLQYPRKFYLVDTGLYRTVAFVKAEDSGWLLENLVYQTLARKYDEVYYWKDRSGKEVDFVIPQNFPKDNEFGIVQVCYRMEDEKTRRREVNAIVKACEEFKVNRALIITRDQWEDIEVGDIRIKAMPFIQWVIG